MSGCIGRRRSERYKSLVVKKGYLMKSSVKEPGKIKAKASGKARKARKKPSKKVKAVSCIKKKKKKKKRERVRDSFWDIMSNTVLDA